MSGGHRNHRSPSWAETLIVNHDLHEANSSGNKERLSAHVVGVSVLSTFQVPCSVGPVSPVALLSLSDGVVEIPAVMTEAAWADVQEREDCESVSSLLHTAVILSAYELQFHLSTEPRSSRFYLSVDELVILSTNSVKSRFPCCNRLPSVRQKITKTWKALMTKNSSQDQQAGLELTELLGLCDVDIKQQVMTEVQRVLSDPRSLLLRSTSFDEERVKYLGEEPFGVPVKLLLIPAEDPPKTPGGHVPAPEDTTAHSPQTSVADPQTVRNSARHAGMGRGNAEPPSNPWDVFQPPCDSACSTPLCDGDLESPPPLGPLNPARTNLDCAAILTSTQASVRGAADYRLTSEQSKEVVNSLPPYQRRPTSSGPPAASASSLVTPPSLRPADEIVSDGGLPVVEMFEKATMSTNRNRKVDVKRKWSEPTAEALEDQEEETKISHSPPSWLFESQRASASRGVRGQDRDLGAGSAANASRVHSDGAAFFYSYQLFDQNLQDFSRLNVPDALVQWAADYLVGNPANG